MNYKILKKVRVIVSIIFLLSISFLFIDFGNLIPPEYYEPVLYLQFIPSLFKFISITGLASIGFIAVIGITFLFGRVYCSSICPLGVLQDIVSYVSGKIRKKNYNYKSPGIWLRYSILILTIISILSGSMLLINLLDPFSGFGKISAGLFRPLVVGINNTAVILFETFDLYILYPVQIKTLSYLTLVFPLILLFTLVWMSFTRGRLYCNTICPAGTLLGLISKYSLIKIKIKEEKCSSCGLCEWVCKAECIDKNSKQIDYSRCVSCFNCLNVCAKKGVEFRSVYRKEEIAVNVSKRNFLSSIAVYLLSSSVVAQFQKKIIPEKETKIPVIRNIPLSPPGSISTAHFTQYCTACHLCISACPAQVLQPAFLEYGILGILQPRMDYLRSFCTYECKVCGDVCPSGAILKHNLDTKKFIQIGKAKFVKDNCIVYTESKDCGACSEHCPTKAVNMVPYKNLFSPEVKEEYCIGCGACEYACPTKPYKAIYVEGNEQHLKAKKNPVKDDKIKEEYNPQEDFPF